MLDLLSFHKIHTEPVNPQRPLEQHQGDCPFCGKDKFFVNPAKQLWDCKTCAIEGNHLTLLTRIHHGHYLATEEHQYQELAKQRKGIQSETLVDAGFAYDADNERWLVPYQNGSDFLNNLGAFYPDRGFKIFKTPGLQLKLYRPFSPKSLSNKIIICEGEWDLLAIAPYIPSDHCIVSVPGAMSFKPEFIPLFRNADVTLLYDKDDAGKAGIAKAIRLLNPVANSIKFLAWPDDYDFTSADDKQKSGTDLRDLVAHNI